MTSAISEFLYLLEYHSENIYEKAVMEANFEFAVIPAIDDTQTLLKTKINILPDVGHKELKNFFNFDHIGIYVPFTFKNFYFKITSEVIKKKPVLDFSKLLMPNDERDYIKNVDFRINNYLFLHNGTYTEIMSDTFDFIPMMQNGEAIIDYLRRLNLFIYDNFTFCDKVSNVHTKAKETLEVKRGVCQDFAHLFIGVCRTQGIAARYVSGYLHQGLGFHGDSFLHAWIEVLIPGLNWVGFDPTNNLLADEHYIKISHGVDYSDCAPIKGALKYSGEMKSSYGVSVKLGEQ